MSILHKFANLAYFIINPQIFYSSFLFLKILLNLEYCVIRYSYDIYILNFNVISVNSSESCYIITIIFCTNLLKSYFIIFIWL